MVLLVRTGTISVERALMLDAPYGRLGGLVLRGASSVERQRKRAQIVAFPTIQAPFPNAETVGFEPTDGLPRHGLSRAAHSTRLCDVSRVADRLPGAVNAAKPLPIVLLAIGSPH